MESTPKLAAKMVLAMKSIDAVAKKGKNQKQGYDYVRAADVANEVRAALIEHGISFDYDVIEEDRWDRATTSGGSMACVQVKVGVTFTDQDSGESKTVRSIGWGMDSLDKAPYKAMTGALKYALRMTFLIPDDADPENDEKNANVTLMQVVLPKLITAPQAEAFRKACTDAGMAPAQVALALKSKGITSSAKIPAEDYTGWMEWARQEAEVPA